MGQKKELRCEEQANRLDILGRPWGSCSFGPFHHPTKCFFKPSFIGEDGPVQELCPSRARPGLCSQEEQLAVLLWALTSPSLHRANLPCAPSICELQENDFWGEPSDVRGMMSLGQLQSLVADGPQLFVEVQLKDGFKADVLNCLCSPGAKQESGLDVGSAGDVAGDHHCVQPPALGQDHQAMKRGNLHIKPVTTVVLALALSGTLGRSRPIVAAFSQPMIS
ncbi:uncharacterized protein LOC141745252 isoform X2 [Larus michahellis]|uniref:uncharacterized protein LOC141745252 isoform X2 n=1 Tax=Larus michahellis TaxID=119627 RepID=UPI003D9AFEB3